MQHKAGNSFEVLPIARDEDKLVCQCNRGDLQVAWADTQPHGHNGLKTVFRALVEGRRWEKLKTLK